MAIMPRKTKYRKIQRGKRRGFASRGVEVNFGEFGLQALERGWIKVNQVEAARKALTHYLKRGGKVWVRVFCDKPATARPAETRMGGGKGAPAFFVAVIKPGNILFEIGGVASHDAEEAFRLAGHKLPIKTRMVGKKL